MDSNFLANIGSAFIYGKTINPSLTNSFAALYVCIGSGSKYSVSGITSNLTQLEPVISRAN